MFSLFNYFFFSIVDFARNGQTVTHFISVNPLTISYCYNTMRFKAEKIMVFFKISLSSQIKNLYCQDETRLILTSHCLSIKTDHHLFKNWNNLFFFSFQKNAFKDRTYSDCLLCFSSSSGSTRHYFPINFQRNLNLDEVRKTNNIICLKSKPKLNDNYLKG